jgi:hypothetical protein
VRYYLLRARYRREYDTLSHAHAAYHEYIASFREPLELALFGDGDGVVPSLAKLETAYFLLKSFSPVALRESEYEFE